MPRLNFKLLWTLLTSLLLLGLLYFFINPFATTSQLDKLHYLGVSAGRMMDRHMQFYENYENVPALERAIHAFLFGDRSAVETETINAYREVLHYLGDESDDTSHAARMNILARLLVTLGETRPAAELEQALPLLSSHPEDEVVANAIHYAYLAVDNREFDPEIYTGANLLPLGWAADRLRYRIALKSGNVRLAEVLLEKLHSRGAQHRQFVMQMVLTVAIIILTGLYLLLRYRVLQRLFPWDKSVLHSPWRFVDGLAVAVTAAVTGLIISLLLHIVPDNPFFTPSFFTSWSTLFASLPMLWLIQHYLLKPRGLTLRRAFGLCAPATGWQHFFTTTGALLALDWIGVLLIGWGTWQLGLGSHWTEGMQERLVFGTQQTVILSTINIVVWAAIFEEIGFRGLIYTTLRQRLTPTTAIVISALIFASLHLYSLAGFLAVFWSGLILAYAYERFQSLLPGIMIHAAGNMLSLGPVLLFYR